MLILPLMLALFYSSVPVTLKGVSQHAQHQAPETDRSKWKQDIAIMHLCFLCEKEQPIKTNDKEQIEEYSNKLYMKIKNILNV